MTFWEWTWADMSTCQLSVEVIIHCSMTGGTWNTIWRSSLEIMWVVILSLPYPLSYHQPLYWLCLCLVSFVPSFNMLIAELGASIGNWSRKLHIRLFLTFSVWSWFWCRFQSIRSVIIKFWCFLLSKHVGRKWEKFSSFI